MTRTLVLGGTAWLGHEIAQQLVSFGGDVTCLARGESGTPPEGATLVRADRREPGAYESVSRVEWDEIVELSYENDLVASALNALGRAARHWTLISSVSVYARSDEPGADEDAALVEPVDLHDYAQAKVAAELTTKTAMGDRLLIARPGLIVGPGDPSDRFGYWVGRFAFAATNPVLVPATEGRTVQVIDHRDLALWVARAGRQGLTGVYNAVGSQHDLSAVLDAAAEVGGHAGTAVSVTDDWLTAHGVNYWAGPRSLPLWLPREAAAFAQRSNTRFLANGGTERSMTETLRDTLADERSRGLDRKRRSGLTRSEETTLLAELS